MKELMEKIVKVLDEKKAVNIAAIEITELTIIADCFIVASGTSNTHIRALAEAVEDTLAKDGLEPKGIEGRATGWILLDYGTVIVHLFLPDAREYYNLERLWADASKIDLSSVINGNQ